jgi:hypothetical protein
MECGEEVVIDYITATVVREIPLLEMVASVVRKSSSDIVRSTVAQSLYTE